MIQNTIREWYYQVNMGNQQDASLYFEELVVTSAQFDDENAANENTS